jgi:hypothetical protein
MRRGDVNKNGLHKKSAITNIRKLERFDPTTLRFIETVDRLPFALDILLEGSPSRRFFFGSNLHSYVYHGRKDNKNAGICTNVCTYLCMYAFFGQIALPTM